MHLFVLFVLYRVSIKSAFNTVNIFYSLQIILKGVSILERKQLKRCFYNKNYVSLSVFSCAFTDSFLFLYILIYMCLWVSPFVRGMFLHLTLARFRFRFQFMFLELFHFIFWSHSARERAPSHVCVRLAPISLAAARAPPASCPPRSLYHCSCLFIY